MLHILEFGATTAIETGRYSFDNMIYLPVKYNLPVPQFDFLFVDKTQDRQVDTDLSDVQWLTSGVSHLSNETVWLQGQRERCAMIEPS